MCRRERFNQGSTRCTRGRPRSTTKLPAIKDPEEFLRRLLNRREFRGGLARLLSPRGHFALPAADPPGCTCSPQARTRECRPCRLHVQLALNAPSKLCRATTPDRVARWPYCATARCWFVTPGAGPIPIGT